MKARALLVALALVACGKPSPYAGNADGLTTLLATLALEGRSTSVLKTLEPETADYELVFDEAAAPKVRVATEALFAEIDHAPRALGKPGDPVRVTGATGPELASGKGAAEECPSGYKEVGGHVKAGVTLYCGRVGSTSVDAFVFVSGRWVLFPKAFRALGG